MWCCQCNWFCRVSTWLECRDVMLPRINLKLILPMQSSSFAYGDLRSRVYVLAVGWMSNSTKNLYMPLKLYEWWNALLQIFVITRETNYPYLCRFIFIAWCIRYLFPEGNPFLFWSMISCRTTSWNSMGGRDEVMKKYGFIFRTCICGMLKVFTCTLLGEFKP